jgi:hypothetical protein
VSKVGYLPDNATPMQRLFAFAASVSATRPRLVIACDDTALRLAARIPRRRAMGRAEADRSVARNARRAIIFPLTNCDRASRWLHFTATIALTLFVVIAPLPADAAELYPSQPNRFVLALSAGGVMDTMMRMLAES